MSHTDADREIALDVALQLILDDSLDAEDAARLKRAREHAAAVLADVEASPIKGPLKRDLNDNESMLAWAVDYLSDVIVGMKGVKAALSTTAAKAYADKNPLGGPAVMFEAMAERIRAGEDYYAVLADYSLAPISETGRGKTANPSLAAQIAWVTGLRDEHAADLRRKGEQPGEGLAMIQSVLCSLQAVKRDVAAICELDGCQAIRSNGGTSNLSHHGEGESVLTERDLFIAECVVAWMATARATGKGWYGDNWMPHRPDFEKSRLFWRFRARKEPLPHPPPTAYSCPWYEVVEEIRPHYSYELVVMDGRAHIAQCGYGIEKMGADNMPEVVTFGPWRFKVWRGPSPYKTPENPAPDGWWIERIAASAPSSQEEK